MKKNFLVKTIAVVAAMAMMTVGLAGCGEKSNNAKANENQNKKRAEISALFLLFLNIFKIKFFE